MEIISRDVERIVIKKGEAGEAELVLNPATGEILDFVSSWTKDEIRSARALI